MGNEILHIVERSSRGRAEQSSLVMSLGLHAEPYEGVREFEERPPSAGVVLVRDEDEVSAIERVGRVLARQGVWLPIIATAEQAEPGRVVAAVEAGVLDYIQLPIRRARLREALEKVGRECALRGDQHRKIVEARARLARLTPREREVLELLSRGASNKEIARELAISPRTVEIHRANMMTKLAAGHAAEAIRLRLEARPEAAMPAAPGMA